MEQKFIDLFDRFTHGGMNRRDFMEKLAGMAGSTAAALPILSLLENNYAQAETVPEGDARLKTGLQVVGINGYVAEPVDGKATAAVIVIHENRGLNAHIKDVARRMALEGFWTFAPDYLSGLGGTPEDADKARDMIGTLKAEDVTDMSRKVLAATGKPTGAVGFCWGGGQVNALAVADPSLKAGVAYYGMQPKAEDVPKIKAPLLLHYAGLDERIDAGIPAFEAALKANGKTYEIYMYDGVNHAFNNDTNAARYNKAAADLAWSRTVAFLKKYVT
ncbi:dienelactone hydrolase family protein [Aestuariivirga sp.]|uniref:dienelactone hydrolase family protein n=1 Tax=Aestuariivirga sp. TaxID=2650926 RepID=UPI0039E42230